METPLPQDFREFLALLNSEKIEYLVVGGYAVGYHGYPRPTGDLGVWVDVRSETVAKLIDVLARFGFTGAAATPEVLLAPVRVIRMGVPPVRIEVINAISGLEFATSYARGGGRTGWRFGPADRSRRPAGEQACRRASQGPERPKAPEEARAWVTRRASRKTDAETSSRSVDSRPRAPLRVGAKQTRLNTYG